VPKGWRFERLGDVSSYLNRGISPKYLEEGGVLVVNQKCIRDFSVDYTKARRHDSTQRKIDGRQLEVGDILVNSTGVGTLGRVAQVLALVEETIVDSHVTVVRSGEKISWPYLGQWMVRQQPYIEAMGEGSTGQTELARSKLAVLPILVPSVVVLTAFDALIKSLKERVAVNEMCVSELAKLRDTLLPRLISGQLSLSEVTADTI
jgi:type I restriction enzyme S subunit